MWTQLKDVRRASVGDLLVWPAEGAVKHLHGSDSTMRELGFSIGRRWNAATYSQIRFLRQRPDETRFFLVREARDSSAQSTDAMSFGSTDAEGGLKSSVSVCELPLHMRANWPDTLGSHILHSTEFNEWTKSWLGKRGRHYGGESLDDYVEEAVSQMRDCHGVRTFFNECKSAAGKHGDDDCFFTAEDASGFLKNAHAEEDRCDVGYDDDFTVRMPIGVLVNASRYGARVIRPTEELKAGIGAMMVSHALPLVAAQDRRLDHVAETFEKRLHAARVRLRKVAQNEESLAKAVGAKSVRAAEALAELAGVCPDFRYLPKEKPDSVTCGVDMGVTQND